jgi:hypothetical protein
MGGRNVYDTKLHRTWEQRHLIAINDSLNPHISRPAARTKSGTFKTNQDSSIDLITIKGQQTLRSKRIKITMPKMPWNDTD